MMYSPRLLKAAINGPSLRFGISRAYKVTADPGVVLSACTAWNSSTMEQLTNSLYRLGFVSARGRIALEVVGTVVGLLLLLLLLPFTVFHPGKASVYHHELFIS
jgi:hypothetical protein